MARAEPGSWASPVNGDEARGTWFVRRESLWGYDASAVDDLLARVASERTPLGQQARWSRTRGGRGYDIDTLDLFLGQLLSHRGPGRDLGDVAQLSRNAPADLTDSPAGLARRRRRTDATRGRTISPTNAGTRGATSATKPARACGQSGQDDAVSCARRTSGR